GAGGVVVAGGAGGGVGPPPPPPPLSPGGDIQPGPAQKCRAMALVLGQQPPQQIGRFGQGSALLLGEPPGAPNCNNQGWRWFQFHGMGPRASSKSAGKVCEFA